MGALALNPFSSFASHLVGGKMTYRYLGSNNYEIKLSIYRDCSDQYDFDSLAVISIYSKANNTLFYNNKWPLFNRVNIPALPPDPCFVPPPGICVEIGNYVDTIQLPANGVGYTITYQRCCRNVSTANVLSPGVNGITITTDVPAQTNNTPQFVNVPPIYICQSDTFNYSFAATDADGDVLVYKLSTPLSATNIPGLPNPAFPPPYDTIFWTQGYNVANQISNSGGMSLNPNTGQLKFKPLNSGQFAFGISVLEYRNNVLINTNRLEIQFNVVNCFLVSSIPTATNLCTGLTVKFQNNSHNANGFHWDFGEPTTTADTSNLFAPTYTFSNYGTYTVSLIAINTAYGFCKDTTTKVITINPLLSPTLQPSYAVCFKNNNILFNVGGSYHPSATFNWNLTTNSSGNSNTNPTLIHFTTPTSKTITVFIEQFGCKDTLQAIVSFSNPVAMINSANLNCNERALNFASFSTGANYMKWDFGVPSINTDTSSLWNPSYTYSAYGIYTVTLIASDGYCADTLIEAIKVFPKISLAPFTTIQKQCFRNNSFNFAANGVYSSNATFTWQFDETATPTLSTMENPTNIHFTQPGNHIIRFTLKENGCIKERQEVVRVFPDPRARVQLSDTSICEPALIKFKIVSDSTHPTKNYWTINDSNFVDTTVYYPFSHAGLYTYSLIVKDDNNCTDTLIRKNSIRINQTPIVKHFVDPLYSTILYPKITFIDSTLIPHYTNFDFGDGSGSNIKNNIHSYQSAGAFPYSLIVTTEFGCADTTTGTIIIDDIGENYIPNVFTPNNDGVNERFFIKGESITQSDMKIFNRWGGLVFETSDALHGWNGIEKHTGRPCSDGTYFYLIKITLENSRKYNFNGTVQLVR